jgi:hypothetical protein
MEAYLFGFHVGRCRYVFEETQYLEIYIYSVRPRTHSRLSLPNLTSPPQDSRYDSVEERPLPLDQFDDFLSQTVRCF